VTVANPWAVIPVTGMEQRCRMGPLLTETPGVDFWWNTQLPNGTHTLADAANWQANEYITPIDQVGGRDGGVLGPPSIAPKVLEVSAMFSAPTPQALHETIEQARYVLGPQTQSGARGPVVWEQLDYRTGVRLGLITRPVGKFDPVPVSGHVPGGYVATVRFSLVAANPTWKFKAGPMDSASAPLLNPALLGGRTYNKSYDWNYGASGSPGGELIANNTGNLQAYPIFTVRGPAVNPVITNATTGQSFQILATLTAGTTVTIDSRSGTITPGSVRISGAPFALAPGLNTIRWRSIDDAYDPAALLTLQWYSTYA
jgi:hypothetical protein